MDENDVVTGTGFPIAISDLVTKTLIVLKYKKSCDLCQAALKYATAGQQPVKRDVAAGRRSRRDAISAPLEANLQQQVQNAIISDQV